MRQRGAPTRRPRRRPVALPALLTILAVSLAACGDDDPAATPSPTGGPTLPAVLASPGEIDPALLEPLRGLGPCAVDVEPIEADPVPGLVLPPGAVVTEQTTDGPLTTVRGYAPLTPVQIRVIYQRDAALEILQIEDEIRESEALLASDGFRLFVKAQAVCEQGSVFIAVVAPEAADAPVPAPTGTADP